MTLKTYIYSPEAVAAMDLDEVKLCFDLGEHDVVFGLTPESLRAICEQSVEAAPLFASVLDFRLCWNSDDSTALWGRAGYQVAMTDKQHLAKLLRIARDCLANRCFPLDKDETGYEAYRTCRAQARKDSRHAVAPRAVRSAHALSDTSPKGKSQPIVAESNLGAADCAPGSAGATDGEKRPPEIFLLPDLFNGQLNISILFTGTGVLTISSDARQRWSEDSPLTISRVSGIESGTTTVQYIGQELHVTDIETYATVIRMGAKDEWGSRVRLGTDVQIGEGALLKAMRRGDARSYYTALREQIIRLQNAKMIVNTTYPPLIKAISSAMPEDEDAKKACETGRLRVVVSLLGDSTSSAPAGKAGTITISIPSRARILFGKGLSTWFKEDEYYRLKKPTSRRLYLLYRRHTNAWGFTREELREYLGSASSSDNGFQKTLKSAFTEMFETGLIAFVPKYTSSKSRHGLKAYEVAFGEYFLNDDGELVRRPGVSP